MSLEEWKKGYSKGYWAGKRGVWPDHKPPLPPNRLIADLFEKSMELRDAIDGACATFDKDDDLVLKLNPYIETLDLSLMQITKWLKSNDAENQASYKPRKP